MLKFMHIYIWFSRVLNDNVFDLLYRRSSYIITTKIYWGGKWVYYLRIAVHNSPNIFFVQQFYICIYIKQLYFNSLTPDKKLLLI